MTARTIITIGNFDGVHVGHAALLRRAHVCAGTQSAAITALAFEPHPFALLRPDSVPPRLTTWPRREQLLREAGADRVVRLQPTRELLGQSPEAFIAWLVREFAPIAIVEGPDFHFGHKRSGNIETLKALSAQHGFTVSVVPPVEVQLSDGTTVTASSSLARWLIQHGRMNDAAAVLGRPYEVEGHVERGDRRGRTIGFPTANVRTECLLPADGVYAGIGHLPESRQLTAAISVGTKPTFGEHRRIIEAYLMDRDAPLPSTAWQPLPGLPEYDWPIRLEIRHWLRDQARYGSLEALLEQMTRDCRRAQELIEGPHAASPQRLATCP